MECPLCNKPYLPVYAGEVTPTTKDGRTWEKGKAIYQEYSCGTKGHEILWSQTCITSQMSPEVTALLARKDIKRLISAEEIEKWHMGENIPSVVNP